MRYEPLDLNVNVLDFSLAFMVAGIVSATKL